MTVCEAITLMFAFGTFILLLINLIINLIKSTKK